MQFVSDLHLHSKYSRAVSPQMVLPEMARWAAKKGINLLTTGDWTHPLWIREIKNQLEEAGEGVYKLKVKNEKLKVGDVRFILTTEIASIYKQGERLRRIHNLLFAPSFEIADKINQELIRKSCNLSSDGRPIVGLSSKQLLELALTIDKRIILIPCHAWTPHFGIYGSASGFDSIEECFGNLSPYIYGIETGISSDPFMNWQIKDLENRSILSFSDAHSAPKMAREATVFEIDKTLNTLSYMDIGKAIVSQMKDEKWKMKNKARIAYTIEFYPEEGKYHFAGHRNCDISKSPEEIKREGNICPVCKRRLTEGVMFRVQQLAGDSEFKIYNSELDGNGVNWIADPMKIHPPFVKLVPLNEIIAEAIVSPVTGEKVKFQFDEMCLRFGSEIEVLLRTPIEEIESLYGEKIAAGVSKVRKGDIFIKPGFDGEYGKVKIWSEEEPIFKGSGDFEKQLGLNF